MHVWPYLDPPGAIDRLVMAIVDPDDAGPLGERLTRAGFGVTRLATAGAFLRRGNATLLIGIPASRVDEVLQAIQAECTSRQVLAYDLFVPSTPDMLPAVPVEVSVGGATVFVFEVEQTVYLGA
jgi:uncharacterized protein YaaQ